MFRTSVLAMLLGLIGGLTSVIDEVRKIPLGSIYSTNGQEGLKAVRLGLEEPYGHDLQEIVREFRSGASNIVLVRGKDIAAALKATRWAFTANRPADVPVDPEDGSKRAPLWLVAFFGAAGSDPPAWLVQSIEVRGRLVRVVFVKPKRLISTRDSHLYFIWVPLGKPEVGTYTLELFDAEKREVTLLRRVTVTDN
jgi:hypothetical protein